MRVVWLDPGRTTGYCIADITNEKVSLEPYQANLDHAGLWLTLEKTEPFYLGYESFDFRQKSRLGLDLYPCELIGVTILFSQVNDTVERLFSQKPSQGKSWYVDNRLRKMGIYVSAKPHAMDAMRHLLHWFTYGFGYQFNKQQSIELAG